MRKWLLLFVVLIPAVELWAIVETGKRIGAFPTLFLLLLAGIAGGWLIKHEGRKAWEQVRRKMQAGEVPGFAMLDGLCVVAGGILLIVPGFVSDVVGLTMLFPLTRPLYRLLMFRWIERKVRSGTLTIHRGGPRK